MLSRLSITGLASRGQGLSAQLRLFDASQPPPTRLPVSKPEGAAGPAQLALPSARLAQLYSIPVGL
eukprot:6481901-Heterocapsa_arctica.AAC.1